MFKHHLVALGLCILAEAISALRDAFGLHLEILHPRHRL